MSGAPRISPLLFGELGRATRATYAVQANPIALGRLRDLVFGVPLALETHQALARDVLAGREVAPDHPYRAYYESLRREYEIGTWDVVRQAKEATVRDIAANGVREPLDLFFGNRGLAYCHGYHRLAVALELGLESVPVRAHLVDAELAELAARLFGIYQGDLRFTLYQPVDHPFFALFPVQEANACWAEKVAAVVGAVSGWAGPVVEVGAHLGGLTRALRSAGVDARAVDVDPLYLSLQPLLEAVGCPPIPYERRALADLVSEAGPVRLVLMGLAHHLLGKPDLWASMQADVLPWMRRAVPELVVEMSLLPTYLGGPAAVVLTSDADVRAFWARQGYAATRLVEGAMQRVTYHVRRGER